MITDPYAIFAAAQKYWQSAVYPKHLSYGITIAVTRDNVSSYAHYHASYDTSQNRVSLFGGSVPLSVPQQTFDYLGVPMLAPNYSVAFTGVTPSGQAASFSSLRVSPRMRKQRLRCWKSR